MVRPNYEAYHIIRSYGNSIYNGDRIDLLAIDKAMNYEAIPLEDRGLTARKIIHWFSIMNNKDSDRMKRDANKKS